MDLDEGIKHIDRAVDFFFEQIRNIRSGTPTPSLVDTVRVSLYGQKIPLKTLAFTSGGGAKPITIKPHDPGTINQINKDLNAAGFSSYVFSKDTICLNVPPISGEEKEKTRKHVRKLGEEAKIAVRNVRKKVKKGANSLTEDLRKECEKSLQVAVDRAIHEIELGVEDKNKGL